MSHSSRRTQPSLQIKGLYESFLSEIARGLDPTLTTLTLLPENSAFQFNELQINKALHSVLLRSF